MIHGTYIKKYFQVRESPAPLNTPTPTPAPDQGGPVAWVGGPIASCRFFLLGSTLEYNI